MPLKQSKTTVFLSIGSFLVIGTKTSAVSKGIPMDSIHVTDGSDWVEAEFLYEDKPRLSVQELAWGFRAIMMQAYNAKMGFVEYYKSLMPNADRTDAQLKYDHDKWLLAKLSFMDITLDSIPGLIDEITIKYELDKENKQGRLSRLVQDPREFHKWLFGVDVGIPGKDLKEDARILLKRTDNHE